MRSLSLFPDLFSSLFLVPFRQPTVRIRVFHNNHPGKKMCKLHVSIIDRLNSISNDFTIIRISLYWFWTSCVIYIEKKISHIEMLHNFHTELFEINEFQVETKKQKKKNWRKKNCGNGKEVGKEQRKTASFNLQFTILPSEKREGETKAKQIK